MRSIVLCFSRTSSRTIGWKWPVENRPVAQRMIDPIFVPGQQGLMEEPPSNDINLRAEEKKSRNTRYFL